MLIKKKLHAKTIFLAKKEPDDYYLGFVDKNHAKYFTLFQPHINQTFDEAHFIEKIPNYDVVLEFDTKDYQTYQKTIESNLFPENKDYTYQEMINELEKKLDELSNK